MKKIPTLFVRDERDRRYVTREVTPGCEWVLAGEGVPTRKYDGTCVALLYTDGANVSTEPPTSVLSGESVDRRWFARREVKPGKGRAPFGFIPVAHDEVTGKTVGWEPIEQSSFAKYHAEALEQTRRIGAGWPAGTYELVGPKVNGNPEQVIRHYLWAHSAADVLDAPRDYDALAKWLADFEGEGIVWHHPDGRMAKLKRRDFPSERG